MQFSVREGERVRRVFVVVREVAVALREVDAQEDEANGTDDVLLEWQLLLVSDLVGTLARQQVVLAFVELFLHFSAEHFVCQRKLENF
mgnify:CR=1 FL=1